MRFKTGECAFTNQNTQLGDIFSVVDQKVNFTCHNSVWKFGFLIMEVMICEENILPSMLKWFLKYMYCDFFDIPKYYHQRDKK
jgi:hypothetical protein